MPGRRDELIRGLRSTSQPADVSYRCVLAGIVPAAGEVSVTGGGLMAIVIPVVTSPVQLPPAGLPFARTHAWAATGPFTVTAIGPWSLSCLFAPQRRGRVEPRRAVRRQPARQG